MIDRYRLCAFSEGYAPDYVLDDSSMEATPPDITYFVRSAFTGSPPPPVRALDDESNMIEVPAMLWDPDTWPAEHVAARYWFVTAKVLAAFEVYEVNIDRVGYVTSWGLCYCLIRFRDVVTPNQCLDLERSDYRALETDDGYKIVHAMSKVVLDADKLGANRAFFVMPVRSAMIHFVREDLAQTLEDKRVLGMKMIKDFSHYSWYWED